MAGSWAFAGVYGVGKGGARRGGGGLQHSQQGFLNGPGSRPRWLVVHQAVNVSPTIVSMFRINTAVSCLRSAPQGLVAVTEVSLGGAGGGRRRALKATAYSLSSIMSEENQSKTGTADGVGAVTLLVRRLLPVLASVLTLGCSLNDCRAST